MSERDKVDSIRGGFDPAPADAPPPPALSRAAGSRKRPKSAKAGRTGARPSTPRPTSNASTAEKVEESSRARPLSADEPFAAPYTPGEHDRDAELLPEPDDTAWRQAAVELGSSETTSARSAEEAPSGVFTPPIPTSSIGDPSTYTDASSYDKTAPRPPVRQAGSPRALRVGCLRRPSRRALAIGGLLTAVVIAVAVGSRGPGARPVDEHRSGPATPAIRQPQAAAQRRERPRSHRPARTAHRAANRAGSRPAPTAVEHVQRRAGPRSSPSATAPHSTPPPPPPAPTAPRPARPSAFSSEFTP